MAFSRKTFEETRIYYYGYSSDQEKEFERYIYKGGGQVAQSANDATHIMIQQVISEPNLRSKLLLFRMPSPARHCWR